MRTRETKFPYNKLITRKREMDKENEKEIRKLYIHERERIDNIDTNQSNLLDTHILAISTAFLGFAIAFIDKIIPLSKSDHNTVLYTSWILFFISILSTIISFKLSSAICNERINHFDTKYSENCTYEEIFCSFDSKYLKPLQLSNNIAIYSFIFGAMLLLAFISINIKHISNEGEQFICLTNSSTQRMEKANLTLHHQNQIDQKHQASQKPTNRIKETQPLLKSDNTMKEIRLEEEGKTPPQSPKKTPPATFPGNSGQPFGKEINPPPKKEREKPKTN